MNKNTRYTAIAILSFVMIGCGGGGGGSGSQSNADADPGAGVNNPDKGAAGISNDDVLDPNNGDVFDRLKTPMTWLQSERFAHSYVRVEADILGTDEGPGFTCDDSVNISVEDLREVGSRITANRVCIDGSSTASCLYDGANGIRLQTENSQDDTIGEIVLISIEGSNNRFMSLFYQYTTSFSDPDIVLAGFGVSVTDNACSSDVTLDFRPDDIHGDWVTRVYRFGDDGGNEIVSSHLLKCANYTCFTDSGDFLIDDVTPNGSSDDSGAFYYEGQSTINDTVGVIRGALSEDKNHFGMVACPEGARKAAIINSCLLITGQRQ